MRTTLKRGIGRGASANGNGRAILPPGALSPISRYMQPPRRRPGWWLFGKIALGFFAFVVLLAGSVAGGAFLFFHHSVGALAPKTAADKRATKFLAKATDPSKPAIALVIGYDRRYHEAGNSRSDTVMLIRTQPNPPAISLLSFPRDLQVEIRCPGHDYGLNKINAAYSFCNSPGTVRTVQALTGLPINYLITVNFRGFVQVVDKLGGIWMDVDRRYFHSNAGTALGSADRYAEINLAPGYQQLNGTQALGFVRYRHTDNDIYRNARQQEFVKAVRQQVSSASITDIPAIVHAITTNVVVGKAGGGGPSDSTVFNYANFLYHMPHGNTFQVKIPNLVLGPSYVSANSSDIQQAVQEFLNPNVNAATQEGSAVLHKRIGPKTKGPTPPHTTVTVLNGNNVPGSATAAATQLDHLGYHIVYPPDGIPANAPRFNFFRTVVYFDPSKRNSKAAAQKIQNLFGSADVLRLSREIRPLSNGSMVVAVVGQTFHGKLAPAPVYQPVVKQPANVVTNIGATIGLLRKRQHRVPFTLEVPTVIERSSAPDPAMPIRVYNIDNHNRAVRLTFQIAGGLDYWGIEETSWADAPVLKDSNFAHTIKGRNYAFYWNGQHLHMVVLYENGATYWVVNSLLDSLSNETMVAIARGLHPLGSGKKKHK